MTISLLPAVMRILTVTTRSKLEILPISGAPAAQHKRGWHRLTLPDLITVPSSEPAQSTQASPGLEMPPDLTLLPRRQQVVWKSRRKAPLTPWLLQEPSTRHCSMVGRVWRRRKRRTCGAEGRRGEGCAGSDHTSEQAATSGEMPMLLVWFASCKAGS